MDKAISATENIVASLWCDLSKYPIVAGILDADDLPDTEAGLIYKIMAEQGKNHVPVRGIVEAEAIRRGVTKDCLTRLNFRGRHETPEALEAYAGEIKNSANRTRLISLGSWIQDQANSEGVNAESLKVEILKRLTSDQTGSQELKPLSHYVDEFEKDFEEWMNGKIKGRSCGFATLGETLRLVNGEFTVIAGRPGSGKTSLAWQMVTSMAEEMKAEGDTGRVAIFSADMSGKALTERSACSLAGVDSRKARRNLITMQEEDAIKECAMYLRSLPIVMDDSSSPSTEHMNYRLLSLNAKYPVRMMMFDFMELSGDDGATEELRISTIAKQLRNICKRMNIPIIAASQISRVVEERQDKIPTMSDLRYSGMIESVADNILLIMRPEYYIKRGQTVRLIEESDAQGVAYVIHAKGRNDGTGFYRLGFTENLSRFHDIPSHLSPKVDSSKFVNKSMHKKG